MSKTPAKRAWCWGLVLAGVVVIAGRVWWADSSDAATTARGGAKVNGAARTRNVLETKAGARGEHTAAGSENSGATGGAAAGARSLFQFVETPEAARLTAALAAPAREVSYVRLDATLFVGKRSPFWQRAGEGRLEIPLPRGGSLVVAIDESVVVGADQFTSTGRIEGRPGSRAVFGYSGGFLHASIEDPVLGAFALRAATEELTQFYRVDPGLVGPCGGERRPGRVVPRAANGGRASDLRGLDGELAKRASEVVAENPQRAEIHVMMVHTTAVLPTLAGAARTQALQSAFLAAVEKVNAAFAASLITARLKLVRVLETRLPGDEIVDAQPSWQDDALTAVYEPGDGVMDEIHAARDAAGADVVCLAVQRADFFSSGLSFQLGEPGRFDNEDYAFAVVQYGRVAGTNVVAHEIGHVLGCAHDRGNAVSGPGAFPYSYGYRFQGMNGAWYHDIMSYPRARVDEPAAMELSYFSNPNIVAPAPVSVPVGIAAGRPGESDTARTIEQTAFATAGYRLQTQAAAGRGVLLNVAARAFVGRGENVLIGGFVVAGVESKRLLVRGAGPALRTVGVGDALRDPVLRVYAGAAQVAVNDDWVAAETEAAAAQVAAFPFVRSSADAALVVTLAPGAYTAVLEGKDESGAGLLEVYDLAPGETARVVNLGTRGYADNAGREMVGGFVVHGEPGTTKRILVRVLGPSLARAPFRMTGVLDDPLLELRNAAGELLVHNDDWTFESEGGRSTENDFAPRVATHGERQILATGHAPANRREPCVLLDLPPGSYTVVVKPFESRSTNVFEDQPAVPGVGVIEVYEMGR